MRQCDHCTAPLLGMRPDARFCSAACRRAAARSDEALTVTRDAAAAVLLHRQSRAVQALLLAQTNGNADQAAAATRALDELDELTAQLFGATPTPGDTP